MKAAVKAISLSASFLFSSLVYAEQIVIESKDLMGLTLLTKEVKSVQEYPGRPALGKIEEDTGQAYAIRSPLTAQQIQYLLPLGSKVAAGQNFAIVSGPEVHHFYSLYKMRKEILDIAQQRYNTNKPLFKSGVISQKSWLDITNEYFDAKLIFDEMQHFFEIVAGFNEENEALTLKSPISGVLNFDRQLMSVSPEDMIARIVPQSAIRLTVNVVNHMAEKLAYLATPIDACKLTVERADAIASGLSTKVWSQPLSTECVFTLGQQLSVTPYFKQVAYVVPKQSVFSFNGKQHILLKQGDTFKVVEIEMVSSANQDYIITSNESLLNKLVLNSSVSAVQGILLGLGGE